MIIVTGGAGFIGSNLVKEHDLRIYHHGSAKLEQLLLPAGEIPGLFIFEVIDTGM